MKGTAKLLLFLICLLSPLVGHTQTEVTPFVYTPGVTMDGITYYLPRTQIIVSLTATERRIVPGPFHAYSQSLLRVGDAAQEERVVWSIDSLKVEAVGVPDKSKMFTIKLRKNTPAPLATLSEDGVLLCVNATATPGRGLAPLPPQSGTDNDMKGREFLTQEILSAGSEAKMAQLTAEEIYDIRESRSDLSKGLADYMPQDGTQLKLMLEKLDTQEKALMQLFLGTESARTKHFRFVYDPMQETEKDILTRFSQVAGPTDKSDLLGEPIYISVKKKNTLPDPAPVDEKKPLKKKEVTGLRYNIPEQVEICLFSPTQTLFQGTFAMGQFGIIEHLGEELFNKRMNTRVFLDPITGGLRKLEAEEPE